MMGKSIIIVLMSLCAFGISAGAKEQSLWNSKSGEFLEKYDPVSYISENKARKGTDEFTHDHQGQKFYFSSESNKQLFVSDPQKYIPAYNGWCAYAMAKESFYGVDPENFKIIDGKTHLFYKGFFSNTLNSWNDKESELKPKADEYWQTVSTAKKGLTE